MPPIQVRCTEAALKKHIQCHRFRFSIHSPSTPKSPSECEQNWGKALKPNKICPHQIQLYHCSICEKVLAASKTVHKQFINSGACEKWCYMEVFSGNQVMRSDKASWVGMTKSGVPHLKLAADALVGPHLMTHSQN